MKSILTFLFCTVLLLGECGERQAECTLRILDWPAGMPGNAGEYDETGFLTGLARRFPDAIKVASKRAMVDSVAAHARRHNCCIRTLILMGHGASGNISTGDGQKREECRHINGNRNEWWPLLSSLRGKFCAGATMILFGCETGAGQAGVDKLGELADSLGVAVRGFTRVVNSGDNPESTDSTTTARPRAPRPVATPPSGGAQKTGGAEFPVKPASVKSVAVWDANAPSLSTRSTVKFRTMTQAAVNKLFATIVTDEAYNGNELGADVVSRVFLQMNNNSVQEAYTTLEGRYFGIKVKENHLLFRIRDDGQALWREMMQR